MENFTRTIYSSKLQTYLLTGIQFVCDPNSTLNEALNIQPGVYPGPGITPTLGYLAIGNGGHKMTTNASGVSVPQPVQHSGTDAELYSQLPFVLRPIANDLTTVQQQAYALRRIEQHNGAPYVAYYLKRIPMTGVVPGMNLITNVNGVSNVTAFVPNASNLNPTPPALSPSGVNIVSGNYVSASAPVSLVFTAFDATELMNVATILYNDVSYAIISEIALCSGIDKVVASPAAGNTTINFNDAIAVQVLSFNNTFYPMNFFNNGLTEVVDIGCTEPLFQLT